MKSKSRPSRPKSAQELTVGQGFRFCLCVALASQQLTAGPLPSGATVVNGELRIQTAGTRMDINQSSKFGIVNWDSFNVGAGHAVNFNNGSGATLNRVTGLDASSINGRLTATGSLFLINRNGIIIGADGQVLTGGAFVASTLDISNADFLRGGGFSLFGNSPKGVTNLGKISSTTGDVLLAGYTVSNLGTITAPAGRVGLAAGTQIDVVTDAGWLNGAYAVSLGERDHNVTNEGRIQALAAELRTFNGNIYALAGNNTGLIQATGVTEKDGRVYLTAANGTVQSTGTVTATRGTDGGDIRIEAANVENYGGTQDVSGQSGGTITIKTDAITSDTAMLAKGASGAGGTITIDANREILLTSAGLLDASGTSAGGNITVRSGPGINLVSANLDATASEGQGGTVSLLGDRVSLLGATVDASGATGGGTVLVGGGYQGALVQEQANASRTYIGDKTTLRADATGESGQGGTVVAWADGTTEFAGTITARGGSASGNGGTVETSGLAGLGVSGTVDASARSASAANGQWLLDPKNITIGTVTDSMNEFRSTIEGFGSRPGADADTNGAGFGYSVSISGENAVVAGRLTGAIYIFESGAIAARIGGFSTGGYPSYQNPISARIVDDYIAVLDTSAYNPTYTGSFDYAYGAIYALAKGTGWRSGVVNSTAPNVAGYDGQITGLTPNFKSKVVNPEQAYSRDTQSIRFGHRFEMVKHTDGRVMVYVTDPDFDSDRTTNINVGAVYAAQIHDGGINFLQNISYQTMQTGGFPSVANAKLGTNMVATSEFVGASFDNGTAFWDDFFLYDPKGTITPLNQNFFTTSFAPAGSWVGEGTKSFFAANNVHMLSVFRSGTGQLSANSPSSPLNLNRGGLAYSGDTLLVSSDNAGRAQVLFYQNPESLINYGSSSPSFYATPGYTYIDPTANAASYISSIAIDGNYAMLGMPYASPLAAQYGRTQTGAVQQFRRINGTWTSRSATSDPAFANPYYLGPLNAADKFIASSNGVDLAIDGNTAIVGDAYYWDQIYGGTNSGRIYVYENGALAASLMGRGIGANIAISGNRIASTGGSSPYRVHLYEKGAAWRNGTANLTSTFDDSANIQSIALDGTTLAYGSPQAGPNALGKVNVFTNIGSGLSNPITLRNPQGVSGTADNFGSVIALSGNTLAASQSTRQLFDAAADGVGNYNVYLFENLANNWATATATRLAGSTLLSNVQDSAGFGFSLGLDNNTLAVGYQRDGQQFGASRGVYVFERTSTWANATTPVARLTAPITARNFGYDVDVDGNTIAVSSPSAGGAFVYGGHGTQTSFSPVFIFQKQDGWKNGAVNHVASLVPTTNEGSDVRPFGATIALSGNNLIASSTWGGGGYQTIRPVYHFTGPFDFSSRASFSTGPGGNLNISAASLANSLSLGTNITLQANNDITVSSAINVNNPTGDGGDLTLQAGRRILVNASITTDNGDLTLVANASGANASFRDAGERVVVLGRDTLNASVTLSLGTGNLVIAAADRFENRTGATDPFRFATVNPGRYLVYSTTPNQTGAPDLPNLQADLATTGRDWVYYNRAFNAASPIPSDLPAGDGFIYTVQPTLGVSVGNASITYGQTVSANLTLSSLTLGGNAVSGTVFGIPSTSSDLANLVNFGFANTVSIGTGGLANAGTYTGGITATAKPTVTTGTVYGVAVSTAGAGNLTVAKKTLDVRPDNATRTYRDANPAFSATYTGFVPGDSISVLDTAPTLSTTAVLASNIGNYAITATAGLDNNYAFNVTGPGQLSITRRDLALTGLTAVNRVYDATDIAPLSGTATIAPLGGDNVVIDTAFTQTAYFASKNFGTAKPVTTFTGFNLTGAQANNYNLVFPTNLTANVSRATLALGGITALDRDYDRSLAAALTGTATVAPLGSDSVSVSGTPSGTFANVNAGVAKPVTVSGLTLGGTDAANYVISSAGITATIRPLALDVTGLAALDKVYDATPAAPLAGTSTIAPLSGDTVTLSGTATGAFADKNVGTAKSVTVAGLSLSGTHAANYVLRVPTGLTAEITPADLALTGLSVLDRVYDATTVAALSGTATVNALGSDVVSVVASGAAASFLDTNVGTAKPVTVTGFTLTGDAANNYNLLQPAGLTATITARPITVSGFVANDKIYDATTSATGTGTVQFGGILSGDDATIDGSAFTIAFADTNVGTAKPLVLSGITVTGTAAANYDATSAFGFTASITPATLTVSGVTALDRLYNATNTVALSGGTLQGVQGSDSITFVTAAPTGSMVDKNIGDAKPVTASGYAVTGTAASNYVLTQPTGLTVNIAAAPLNLVGLSADKTYDGTRTAPLSVTGLDAVFSGDLVSADLSAVSAIYADKFAGLARPVTLTGLFGLSGNGAGNYTLAQPSALTGTIARRGITVSGLTIADKTYDGTVFADISGTGTFGGTITGDDLAINVGATTVTFADANAGVNKTVALSGVTLSGNDKDNYTATTPTGLTATILKKDLTVTGLAAVDRVYDRTLAASLTGTGALQGVLTGESITLDESTRTAAFADKNVGTAKSVTVSGLILSSTSLNNPNNYRLVSPALSASITPADASVIGLAAVDRVYDTTRTAPLTGTATLDFGSLNNVLASAESISLSGIATGTFTDKHVSLSPKSVTVSGLTLAGTDAANYTLRLPTTLSASVTRADLAITGASVANKTYDATLAATLSTRGVIAPLGADSVTLVTAAATASFLDKNVGTAKSVTASGYSLSGGDAGNYRLIDPAGLTASITQADLLVTGLTALDRFYDRTAIAQLSGTAGIAPLGSDVVTLTGTPTASFFDKSAGKNRPVTVTGFGITGTAAGNYNLVAPLLSATVNPRFVTIGGLSANDRTYDRTTAATLSGSATFTGFLPGDDLTFALSAITATFADKNVGLDKPVTLTGAGLRGTDASNYSQVLPFDLVADIAAKQLSVIGADAVDRVYDRTLNVVLTGGALSGTVTGDVVNLVTTSASGLIANKNAQTAPKPVTASGYAITGTDATNYALRQPTGIDVLIAPRQVDISGVQVAEKLFDGNTSATVSGGTLSNVVSGDALALVTTQGTASFATADVGNNKPVVLSGFTLAGDDAANYVLNAAPRTTGRILPSLKEITEVIPAEVLRASSTQATEVQRAQLVALAAAKGDKIPVIDLGKIVEQATTGLIITKPNLAILNTPLDQQDQLTKNYIAAAYAADAASNNLQTQAIGFRIANQIQKETGQQLNQTAKAIEVERGLRSLLVGQFEQVNNQLALANKNLEAIADAKRNIADFTQRLADAARLGRGSEVAEYQRIIDAAKAIVATEAKTLAQRDALALEAASGREKIAANDRKVAELETKKDELSTKLAEVESRLANVSGAMADAKAKAAAAAEKLAQAQAAGAAAYASSSTSLQQADALLALADSDVPAKTAATMVANDPLVKQFESKAATAAEVTNTVGQGLATVLSPAALAYAKSVADKINSGGVLDDSTAMRDSLVKSVPALRELQTQLDSVERTQAQEAAAMEARIAQTIAAKASVSAMFGITLTPEQQAQQAAQERARLNDRLNQLTGGALDLSKVPTKNADGEALTELERISIAILNKQLNTPQGAAGEAGTFAAGYKDRLNEAVAQEFGFSPEQALNDPRVLAKEVVNRQPFNSDGSLDKEQLAENMKVAASAYVNLSGSLKDEAIKQAATQDPTGAAQAYVGAEKAARDEFVKTYGAQPEDVITSKINARIDAYKNADSPEALLRVHAASMVPGGEMTIEAATKAYNDLKAGKSPDAVAKDMASNLWNGSGDGPSARDQAAQAARTAAAAQDAAITSLEQADKTGFFKASNTITGAAGEEFAKTFGGSPQELGIKALENPGDAANQVKNAAKDILTTPDGALNAVKGGIATYSNMADATLAAAKQQLDVVGAKFGDAGKAAAFVAKHGITAVTEVKNFMQDAASTLTGGLIAKSGPSKTEVENAIAFAKAQEEVARAESQKREDAMLLQYLKAAQDMARLKAQMAAGVVNAKAQVGQYLVASQQQAKQEKTAAAAKQAVTAEITRVVQTGLTEKAQSTKAQASAGLTTEQMQAKAALWSKGS